MTLSEIQRALAECETVPTRSLGQNFLHDQNLARRIVECLEIQPGDHVIEIGPGLGALTEFLARPDIRLTLIEKDGRLARRLGDGQGFIVLQWQYPGGSKRESNRCQGHADSRCGVINQSGHPGKA